MLSHHQSASQKLKNSLILLFSLLLLGIVSIVAFDASKGNAGSTVVVEYKGNVLYELSLYEDMELTISNNEGSNTIEIKDGMVFVSHADCKDQICVEHAKIHSVNEAIICLPHKLTVTIKGTEKGSEIDAVAN